MEPHEITATFKEIIDLVRKLVNIRKLADDEQRSRDLKEKITSIPQEPYELPAATYDIILRIVLKLSLLSRTELNQKLKDTLIGLFDIVNNLVVDLPNYKKIYFSPYLQILFRATLKQAKSDSQLVEELMRCQLNIFEER